MSHPDPRKPGTDGFRDEQAYARARDEADPVGDMRRRFLLPRDAQGEPLRYFCGHSLGLQPRDARAAVTEVLDDWAGLGVNAHFSGRQPWYPYHELFRESAALLVGARAGEVVMMNSLTVNLHLMMTSFYRPDRHRYRILIEDAAFPSDIYAVKSQLALHGVDPGEGLIVARPREGESRLRTEDLVAMIRDDPQLALVMLGGVNYFTGQCFDMARIAAAAHEADAVVGFDLAHAAGNVPLALHDWDVDFAVWCTYKYLNAGPGAVAGCFVHERHGQRADLPRLAGWWGNDPQQRFLMHLLPDFQPVPGAEGWQLSNPPILAMAPLRASLAAFTDAGMERLRRKSEALTGYLEFLVDGINAELGMPLEILTPREPASRGCQLSIRVAGGADRLRDHLEARGCVCDYRRPDVIRVAPVPLYNTFDDVRHLAGALREALHASGTGNPA